MPWIKICFNAKKICLPIVLASGLLVPGAVGAAELRPALTPGRSVQSSPTAPAAAVPTARSVTVAAVSRVTPNRPTLKSAGGSVRLTLAGSGLNLVSSAQVLKNGRPVQGVSARLGKGTPSSVPLTLIFPAGIAPGRYQLSVVAGGRSITVSPSVFEAAVSAPQQQSVRVIDTGPGAAVQPEAPKPAPLPVSREGGSVPTAPPAAQAARTAPLSLQRSAPGTGPGKAPPSGPGPSPSIRGTGDQGGLRARIQQTAPRQTPKTDFGTAVKVGSAKTGSESTPSATKAAPFIPGGTVVSSAVSGEGSSDSGSGSGLKSASGAEGRSADQEADEAGQDSKDVEMPPEVPLEEELDPQYARLVDLNIVSRSAAQSGLEPEEVAEFAAWSQLFNDSEERLHSSSTWERVAKEGTTEGIKRETVAEQFGAPKGAAGVGLNSTEMVEVIEKLQKWGAEDRAGDLDTWKDAAKYGADKVESDVIREHFGIPKGVLPGVGPETLVEGVASIQERKGDPSDRTVWDQYSRDRGDTGTGTGSGTGDGTGAGTDMDYSREGVSSGDNLGGPRTSRTGSTDSSTNGTTGGTHQDSSNDTGLNRDTPDGTNTTSFGSGNNNSRDTDSASGSSSASPEPGSTSGQSDEGHAGNQGWTGPEPGEQSSDTGTALIQNSVTNGDGSYSYDWDMYDSEGNYMGSGSTECSGGTCTDSFESGGSTTYDDYREEAPADGVHDVAISNGGGSSGGGNNGSGGGSGGSDTSGDDSGTSDGEPGDDADNSDDDSDSSDDSADSDDEDDDSDDSSDDSDSDDSGSSEDDALPADPERFASGDMSMARRMAMVDKQTGGETQPADPDGRSGSGSGAPVLRDPTFGEVNPVDDGSGTRTGTSGSGVPDDPQDSPDGPDPVGDESGSSSSSGPHIPANTGEDMSTASGVGTGSGGDGLGAFGGGASAWQCRRALIEDSRGGLWCYCPVSADPVTGVPIIQWERVEDTVDTSSESLVDIGAAGGSTGGTATGAGTPYCREYSGDEWRQAYPGETLPDGPPASMLY